MVSIKCWILFIPIFFKHIIEDLYIHSDPWLAVATFKRRIYQYISIASSIVSSEKERFPFHDPLISINFPVANRPLYYDYDFIYTENNRMNKRVLLAA